MLSLAVFIAFIEIIPAQSYDPGDHRFEKPIYDARGYKIPPRPSAYANFEKPMYDARGYKIPPRPLAYVNGETPDSYENQWHNPAMYDMETVLTRTKKWPEFLAKLQESSERADGKVMKDWEGDAHKWMDWVETVQDQAMAVRETTTLRTIMRIAESAENPSPGMESYWSGAKVQQEQPQALGLNSMDQMMNNEDRRFRRMKLKKEDEALMFNQDLSKEETRLRTLYELPPKSEKDSFSNILSRGEQQMKQEHKDLGLQFANSKLSLKAYEPLHNENGSSRYSRQYLPPYQQPNQNEQPPNSQNRPPNIQNGRPPNFQRGPPAFQGHQNGPQGSPNGSPFGYQNGPPRGPQGYQNGPPMGYQNGPPMGFQNGPPPGFQNRPPMGYQNGPPPGYQNRPPMGYQNGPPPGYQNGLQGYQNRPPMGYNNGPPSSYQNGPPMMGYQNGPPMGYNHGPPPNYQNGPPMGYQNGPPMGYNNGPPPGYQKGPPLGYQNAPPMGYQNGPPQNGPHMVYNNGPPMGYNIGPPMGSNNGPSLGGPDYENGPPPDYGEGQSDNKDEPQENNETTPVEDKQVLRIVEKIPEPLPITHPPTPRRTTRNPLATYNLPETDDFFSPVRWVKFNSVQIIDGLARVTDPDTGTNRQYTINGTIYVPIIDSSKIGGEPTTELVPVQTKMKVLRRERPGSNEMKNNQDLDWLDVEHFKDPHLQRDRSPTQCADEGCKSRCKTKHCKTSCSGDTCSAGCESAFCVAQCTGSGCKAMCLGEQCTAKCSGMACDAKCLGSECKAESSAKQPLSNLIENGQTLQDEVTSTLFNITLKLVQKGPLTDIIAVISKSRIFMPKTRMGQIAWNSPHHNIGINGGERRMAGMGFDRADYAGGDDYGADVGVDIAGELPGEFMFKENVLEEGTLANNFGLQAEAYNYKDFAQY